MRLKTTTFWIILALTAIFVPKVYANEGDIELRSSINHSNRCLASSHTNSKNTFTLLVSCRNLNYTPTSQVIRYLLWASPVNSNEPLLVGDLNFGKGEFIINYPFNSLFVTIEQTGNPKSPTGQVIMRGNVEPYDFLDPTGPTPTVSEEQPDEDPQIVVEITPTPESGISGLLKRGGVVVSIILLGLLIGFIFIITRPRK